MRNKYTSEQIDWIRENMPKYETRKEVAAAFTQRFGIEVTASKLNDLNKRYNFPPCKLGGKATQFKTHSRTRALPIGTVRKATNCTMIKIADNLTGVHGYTRPDWIPLQEYIYCKEHGAIPEDSFVCFLDGNRENFELSNLYPVNRKIIAIMANNRWWSKDPDKTLTAIKWAELFYKIKECENERKRISEVSQQNY